MNLLPAQLVQSSGCTAVVPEFDKAASMDVGQRKVCARVTTLTLEACCHLIKTIFVIVILCHVCTAERRYVYGALCVLIYESRRREYLYCRHRGQTWSQQNSRCITGTCFQLQHRTMTGSSALMQFRPHRVRTVAVYD